MPDTPTTIVLGGGISGLAVAHFLDGPATVLEATERPGGLCKSMEKDGFVYDIGGHILFSKNEAVLGEMKSWLGGNLLQRRRMNDIWYKDRFVKYPFENGLSALEKEEIFEILTTYLRREGGEVSNLAEWCYRRFGTGLAEKYLLPYNRKIWKRDPAEMSVHWVERIPSPPEEDIIKSAIGIETEGYTFQLNFNYPEKGGYEAVVRGVADKVSNIRIGFRAETIRRAGNEWHVSNGSETVHAERLVSTIPIFNLIPCLENVPDEVSRAVDRLVYTSLLVHMIGVKHEGLTRKTATYVPDLEVLPHRICYMKEFSPHTAPEGCSHLITETTCPPGDALLAEDDDLVTERIANQIREICGYEMADICATDVHKVQYAYPVYDLDYERNVSILYDYMDSQGIYFSGRFAAYRYINSDKCVEFAMDLAAALNRNETFHRNWNHV